MEKKMENEMETGIVGNYSVGFEDLFVPRLGSSHSKPLGTLAPSIGVHVKASRSRHEFYFGHFLDKILDFISLLGRRQDSLCGGRRSDVRQP